MMSLFLFFPLVHFSFVCPDYDYNYETWDAIEDPNDWERFYDSSTASDFSDFQAVVRPTVEELKKYGHQAQDFILQCTFDTQPCSYK